MIPRFLSFIELLNLFDAAKISEEHLAEKIAGAVNGEKSDLENARQSLLRSIFISGFSIVEQNLDEFALMKGVKQEIKILPKDLKDRGIKRSINYGIKVLGASLDLNEEPWVNLFALQEVRNHLVHYGPNFSESKDHKSKYEKFSKLELITMGDGICFTIKQIEDIFSLLMKCVTAYVSSQKESA